MLLVRLFLAFPLLFLFFQLLKCTEQKEKSKVERISIKIVENPAKPIGTGFSSWNQPKKLNLRVPPAPFSGMKVSVSQINKQSLFQGLFLGKVFLVAALFLLKQTINMNCVLFTTSLRGKSVTGGIRTLESWACGKNGRL
eukprot:m.89522 g.89522  ORF g.89522 m.89522 type:complete len:140 (+) comp36608_c0_seq8:21-440(+)